MNEKRLIQKMTVTQDIAGPEMILPNTSGDHVKGIKRAVPVADADLANKKYVDDQIPIGISTAFSVITNGYLVKKDALGLTDSSNTDAQIAIAVGASHSQNSDQYLDYGGAQQVSATQAKTAYTHSQIAGGDSVHVSVAENTAWDTAYTHSQDNTQAHSDYMLNTGDTATGNYAFDTNTLYIDATNDRVGIGTASPTDKLSVYSAAADPGVDDDSAIMTSGAYGGGISMIDTASATMWLSDSGANWKFGMGAANAARSTLMQLSTNAGNAVLSVLSPRSAMAYFGGNDANNWITLSDNNGTNSCNLGSISGGNMYAYTLGYISFYPGGNNWIRFTSAGYAGFGVVSPDSQVEIETASDTAKQALTIDQNDDDQAFIDYQGTSAANATKNISTAAFSAFTYVGMVKIEVNGSAYWMPYYQPV